jgi:hypothetical protein
MVSVVEGTENVKVNEAFSNALKIQESRSSWYDNRQEAVPLKIVTTAYVHPNVKKLPEYAYLNQLAKLVGSNKGQLDVFVEQKVSSNKLTAFFKSDKKLSESFSAITVNDYDSNNVFQDKLSAAFRFQKSDKDSLNDALREYSAPGIEQIGAEIVFGIDYDEYQKGNLTLFGYKTIKDTTHERNSYFYTLTKKDYAKLSDNEKKEAVLNGFLTALQLSIPEYVSIDRNNLVDATKPLYVMRKVSEINYQGEIYKYQGDTTQKDKLATQLLLTTSLPENDIKYLINSSYLTQDFNYESISSQNAQIIADIFNLKFMDTIPSIAFGEIYANRYDMKSSNVDGMLVLDDIKTTYKPKEIYFQGNYEEDKAKLNRVFANSKFVKEDIGNTFAKISLEYLATRDNLSGDNISNTLLTFKSSTFGKHELKNIENLPRGEVQQERGFEKLKYNGSNLSDTLLVNKEGHKACSYTRKWMFMNGLYTDGSVSVLEILKSVLTKDSYNAENNCKSNFTALAPTFFSDEAWNENNYVTLNLIIEPIGRYMTALFTLGGYKNDYVFSKKSFNTYTKNLNFHGNVFKNEIRK